MRDALSESHYEIDPMLGLFQAEPVTDKPLVSILLPVYNGERYLKEAIESILWQTYENFELIIIDDGSTDGTAAIIASFDDERIRYYSQPNKGLSESLNRSILLSSGKYLARQDADDVSLPTRLATQVQFLESVHYCGLVGTWAEIWSENKKTNRLHKHPTDGSSLKFELLFNNPFVHSSVMIRKDVFDRTGLYSTDPLRHPPEDYELWSRVATKYAIANIPETLQIYRETKGSECRTKNALMMDRVVTISAENLAHAAGLPVANEQCVNIAALANNVLNRVSNPDIAQMKRILYDATNSIVKEYPADGNLLQKEAKVRMGKICLRCVAGMVSGLLRRFRE